jgi:hypothetical protein
MVMGRRFETSSRRESCLTGLSVADGMVVSDGTYEAEWVDGRPGGRLSQLQADEAVETQGCCVDKSEGEP